MKLIQNVARYIHETYNDCSVKGEGGGGSKDIRIISNGNMASRNNVQELQSSAATSFLSGIMCGEGLLRDPAIFYTNDSAKDDDINDNRRDTDTRYELFREYCALSNAYYLKKGWEQLDSYNHAAKMQGRANHNDGRIELEEEQVSIQIDIARQHLTWMLGKSGHGRSVRYRYINTKVYRRHTDLLKALNEAKCLEELLSIAEINLPKGLKCSDEFNQNDF